MTYVHRQGFDVIGIFFFIIIIVIIDDKSENRKVEILASSVPFAQPVQCSSAGYRTSYKYSRSTHRPHSLGSYVS